MPTAGLHISFTGIDGAGKSTQMTLLCKWLKRLGFDTISYEEGRNLVAETAISLAREHGIKWGRDYLGENLFAVSISFELLRQNLTMIRPYVNLGKILATSRSPFDWLAGSLARGASPKELALATEIALHGGLPECIIWLDTSPEIAYRRIMTRGTDSAALTYLRLYQKAFATVLAPYPHARISGNASVSSVAKEVRRITREYLRIR